VYILAYFALLNLQDMSALKYSMSYWEKESFFQKSDIAIIGAGIVGLFTAIHLKQSNPQLKVTVIDRGVLPIGASTRNAGFACFGSMTELLSDIEKVGEDASFALVERRYRGLRKMREMLGDDTIDYQPLGGYELFTDDEEDIYQKCQEAMPYFNEQISKRIGTDQYYSKADHRIASFGFGHVDHLIWNKAEGQLDVGKMMKKLLFLAQELDIHIMFGMQIENIEDTTDGVNISTAFGWSLQTEKLVVATNGFTNDLIQDLDVTPARNLVLVTEPIPNLKVEGSFHYENGYYYFRNIHNRILLGGGRNLAMESETTSQFGVNELIKSVLVQLLHTKIIPGRSAKVERWWSGILGIGKEKKPILKHVSPNVVVAVRLGGMGVAIGSLVGEEAAQLVMA
jgi:glycine/D-amino acid oxidase-like deaminating enzyme